LSWLELLSPMPVEDLVRRIGVVVQMGFVTTIPLLRCLRTECLLLPLVAVGRLVQLRLQLWRVWLEGQPVARSLGLVSQLQAWG